MTPEEMRIGIAEACGYYTNPNNPGRVDSMGDVDGSWLNDSMPGGGFIFRFEQLPDYCNDLNAMNEAERTALPATRRQAYYEELKSICYPSVLQYAPIHATAAQRAEAFCRVMFPERFTK